MKTTFAACALILATGLSAGAAFAQTPGSNSGAQEAVRTLPASAATSARDTANADYLAARNVAAQTPASIRIDALTAAPASPATRTRAEVQAEAAANPRVPSWPSPY